MKYIVYKTVNLINHKFYIGVHLIGSQRDYLGSGKLLKRATKIKCLTTGKVWSTIKQASIELNIHRSTLSAMLNGYQPNITSLVKG